MLKIRIIPVLTFNGISLVKTKKFSTPRIVGNPIQSARIYNSRNVDELVFLDIFATHQKRKINLSLVKKVIDECFMPVTIGGGIKSFDDINNLLRIGADKVIIKSKAINDNEFIQKAVSYFGSQCISIAIDSFKLNSEYLIFHSGEEKIKLSSFIKLMNLSKVGELVINSVDHDGMMIGYDIDLFNQVTKLTKIPLVALGGAGKPEHFKSLLDHGFNGGLAASSIFHFSQYTPNDIKNCLHNANYPVRI
tara:strand:- start:16347 stop:17093 length:747 start_codon:yes stop_codon:yes gene_type:complete